MITTPTDPTLTDSMKQRFCHLVDDWASLASPRSLSRRFHALRLRMLGNP
ncbi:MAG: hypothetical protein ACREOV_08995 [Candidatus Dormibacteraceae bacterium]